MRRIAPNSRQFSVTLKDEQVDELDRLADERGTRRADLIRQAVTEWLRRDRLAHVLVDAADRAAS